MTPVDITAIAETLNSLMTESKPNEWLPVLAALGGVLVGSFTSWLLEKRREGAFAKQIENCLVAEISALIEIIEHRKYMQHIAGYVEDLRSQPAGKTRVMTVDVPLHYSRVYQDNCKHVGVVKTQIAHDVITFHQLIDAVIQDIKPGGTCNSNKGAELETYVEMQEILEQALKIGKELTKNIENPGSLKQEK